MARAFQSESIRPRSLSAAPVAIVAALALLAWFIRSTLLLVFAGILLGIVLRWAAQAAQRITRLPIVGCVWLVVAVFAITLALALAYGGGAFVAQWTQLAPSLQRALAAMSADLRAVPGVASALASFDPSSLVTSAGAFLSRAGGIVNNAFGALVGILVVLFVAVAGALEPALYRTGFIALWPPRQRATLSRVLDEWVATLRLWLRARAISMCVTGLLVWAGLSILRIPFAAAFAMLAAVLAFIPNIGAFIAAAPAVLAGFAISPRLALAVVVMYWVVHAIDDFAVAPFIERRVVRLPPILTLIAQIVLAAAAGTLGVMLAAPLVAVVLVAVQRLWVDQLEGKPS